MSGAGSSGAQVNSAQTFLFPTDNSVNCSVGYIKGGIGSSGAGGFHGVKGAPDAPAQPLTGRRIVRCPLKSRFLRSPDDPARLVGLAPDCPLALVKVLFEL